MAYNNMNGAVCGVNAGTGNRAVASHIKDLHAASKYSGSVSSSAKPSMSKGSGGSAGSPLSGKKPRRSISKSSALMD